MIGYPPQEACDPQLTWVAIAEAMMDERCAELAEIAFSLYGRLGEARAENDRLRARLQSCLCEPRRDHADHRNGSHPESYAVLIASTRLRALSLVTIVVR
jgi:hypothetical protein